MFLTPRRFLVVFLTILQFIMPFVHAHEGGQFLKQGLHVPGLENYSALQDELAAQIKVLKNNSSTEGMIVAVDVGVKQKYVHHQNTVDSDYFILQSLRSFNTATFRINDYRSPSLKPFSYPVLIEENSPRAPPAL